MLTSPLSTLLRFASLLFGALALTATGIASAQAAPPPERLFEVLEQAVADLPKDRFDLEAALAEIGSSEVEAIFGWVRDDTGFVAYRGAMKGAAGVLMDRQGNSLDRALLLERLLEGAGHRTALAHATLPSATLEAAAAAQRVVPLEAAGQADPQELSARAAAELDIDQEVLAEEVAATGERMGRFSSTVETRADR